MKRTTIVLFLVLFFFPLTAMGYLVPDRLSSNFQVQRYSRFLHDNKLALTITRGEIKRANFSGHSRSFYPENYSFLPPDSPNLRVEVSPRIQYRYVEHSYPPALYVLTSIIEFLAPTYGEIKLHRDGNSFRQMHARVSNNELESAFEN